MTCERQFGEDYDLFAAGVLDAGSRAEIQSHLDAGCAACIGAIRLSLANWAAFGMARTPANIAVPATLRKRILLSVSGLPPAPARWGVAGWPAWAQAFAAAALIGAGAGAGWFSNAHRAGSSPAPVQTSVARRPADVPATPPPDEIPRLTARLDAEQKTALASRQSAASDRHTLAAVQRDLAAAQQASIAASASLAKAESELADNRAQLAEARAGQRKTEAALTGTIAERDRALAERNREVDREQRLSALNRDLENQVRRYKDAADARDAQLRPLMRLAALVNSPSLRMLRLQGAEGRHPATGNAFVVEGASVTVYVAGLPAPAPGKTYQLWLIRKRSPAIVSGGIFKPDAQGSAVIQVDAASAVGTVAVTEEPDGGSKTPTGPKLLIGVQS